MSINQLAILVIDILLFVVALTLFVPTAILWIECSAAFLPDQAKKLNSDVRRPKIAVLVPAHNEETEIGATIETILPQLTKQDRLLVIADNCHDRTAAVARNYGVTVIEREELDPNRRGKGYALDYGLSYLAPEPPEIVINVDADCFVAPDTIEQIAKQAIASGRPVQSTYLMAQPENPGLNDMVSALAVKVKNLVRMVGVTRLGIPCLLTGSGMAFPWSVIRQVSLAGSKTVDDMQLALDLAIAGYPPTYCQQAQVKGRLMKQSAAKSQRTRWEHGHIETLLTEVPKLVKAAVQQKRFDLLAMALDLCVPPLSLLVLIWAATMAGATFAGILGASWLPAILLAIEGLLILISIIEAWVKFGRSDLPIFMLFAVPFYIVWKIPLYLAYLIQPQTKWTRTERDLVDT